MTWRWAAIGIAIGYAVANTRFPAELLETLSQLRHFDNKGGLFLVILGLLAFYLLFLALPLACLAARSKQRYTSMFGEQAAEEVRTSFRRNLKKRGSFGHLEFLGFEIKTSKELVLNADSTPR